MQNDASELGIVKRISLAMLGTWLGVAMWTCTQIIVGNFYILWKQGMFHMLLGLALTLTAVYTVRKRRLKRGLRDE